MTTIRVRVMSDEERERTLRYIKTWERAGDSAGKQT